MSPYVTAAEFYNHILERGVCFTVEQIWWHSENRRILRVRDPQFCMTLKEREALCFWEADIKARIEEWTTPAPSLPSTWFHPGTSHRGIIDVPIEAIAGAEVVHMMRVDDLGKLETL